MRKDVIVMKVIVRKELEEDHKTVELLVEEAFKDAEYSDHMLSLIHIWIRYKFIK